MNGRITLTEAQKRDGFMLAILGPDATHSTFRSVPYTDIYRQATGDIKTPAQHLQQTAREQQQRSERNGAS